MIEKHFFENITVPFGNIFFATAIKWNSLRHITQNISNFSVLKSSRMKFSRTCDNDFNSENHK